MALDTDASSPRPGKGIWRSQHQCVSDHWTMEDVPPSNARSESAIIKHQLAGDRGHYSVLNFGFVVLHFKGFDHNTVMQIVRHKDSCTLLDEDLIALELAAKQNTTYLVQSGRYTGERFIKVASGELSVEEVFYVPPVGRQRDREGNSFEYTQTMREFDIAEYYNRCVVFKKRTSLGQPYENARYSLPQCFRQDFSMSSTIEALWHWMDLRTKANAQDEIRIMADMVLEIMKIYTPLLSEWYIEHRYKKAKLAP